MRKTALFIATVLIAACIALPAAAMPGYGAPQSDGPVKARAFTAAEVAKMKKARAIITTKFGEIEIRFFPEAAPNHVDNFLSLARSRYYDGTVFHRVIPGFMVQGGDPESKSEDRARHGIGGPGYTLKAEFGSRPHVRGILSMARKGHPDSAGSQFFIMVAPAPQLDGKYTVFGEVVRGMDVVDKIVALKRDGRDNPIDRAPVTVRVIEK